MIRKNYEVYNVSPLLINNFGDTFSLLLVLLLFSMFAILIRKKYLKKNFLSTKLNNQMNNKNNKISDAS